MDSAVQDAHPDVVEEPPATCGGSFACVPAVPTGWSGPVELYSGSSPAPTCTTDFSSSYDGNGQLSAPPATCTCSCNAPTTGCAAPDMTFFTTGICTVTPCYSTTLQNGVCTTINDSASCIPNGVGSPHMSALAPSVTAGNCTPQHGKQLHPTTWGTYAQACSSTTAVVQLDCQTGSVCAPTPAAPYGQTLCVSRAGDLACPSQGYTAKQVFYGSVSEGRSCSGCTCGGLTGASCAAVIDSYSSSDGSCGGSVQTYDAPFSCDSVNQPGDFRLTLTPQNGSCAANPDTATGAATPASPTTFCCLP